ncbi:hypothetical protein DL96DRAFT_1576945 [Flagelloscypha sp. PMI_526]|nr:hypothetical protein DL96DRAFT_1576945 [Flagelloscypha sp. PMI_526]
MLFCAILIQGLNGREMLIEHHPLRKTHENADVLTGTVFRAAMKSSLIIAMIVPFAIALPAFTPVQIQHLNLTEPGLCKIIHTDWTGGAPPYRLQLVDMNTLEVLQNIGIENSHGNGHHFNWQIKVATTRYVVLSITDDTRIRAMSEPFLIEMTGEEKCKYDRSPLSKDYFGHWYTPTGPPPNEWEPSTPEIIHSPMDRILRTCKPTKFEWWGGQPPYRLEIVEATYEALLEDLWIVSSYKDGWMRTWTPDFILYYGRVRVKITDARGFIVLSQPFTIVNDEPGVCIAQTLTPRHPLRSIESPPPISTSHVALPMVTHKRTRTRYPPLDPFERTINHSRPWKGLYIIYFLVVTVILSFKHCRMANRILHFRRASNGDTRNHSGKAVVWERSAKVEKGPNSAETEGQ